MSLQEAASRVGRRATKFCPANVQKIKDWVAEGISREEIAKSLGATVGSLQVTCSRLGISLRGRRDNDPRRRVESRAFVSNGRVYAGHLQPAPTSLGKFQLVLKSQGTEQTTDLAFTDGHVGQLGVEASAQGLGITDLMSRVLTQALKKGLIQKILDKK